MLLNLVDYITPVDSGVSATQWDFSYPTNNLQKEEIKRGEILLIEALIRLFIYLVVSSCLGIKKSRRGCLNRKASRKLREE